MDSHMLLILVVSTVVLITIYLSHSSIDQRLRELAAEQAKLCGIIAPQDHPRSDGDGLPFGFFKLADILTGTQRAPKNQTGMPTIVEEAEASANEGAADDEPAEQVGVRKRKRTNEIKTSG